MIAVYKEDFQRFIYLEVFEAFDSKSVYKLRERLSDKYFENFPTEYFP